MNYQATTKYDWPMPRYWGWSRQIIDVCCLPYKAFAQNLGTSGPVTWPCGKVIHSLEVSHTTDHSWCSP